MKHGECDRIYVKKNLIFEFIRKMPIREYSLSKILQGLGINFEEV